MGNNNGNKERKDYVQSYDRNILCPRPIEEVNWVADQLVEWAKKDDSVTLLSFHGEYMVSQTTMYEWEHKFPQIREAMRAARSLVGARREKLALENKFNASIVSRTMGIYDERVRAYDREMKMLGAEGGDKAQTINVVMPSMPNTEAVPKKKSRKKDTE